MDIPSYVLGKKAGGGGGSNYQSKSVEITENGTTSVTADTGYDALSNVNVTVSGILDTSDATAAASDMATGVTAYVNGSKITGNVPVGSSSVATNYASNNIGTYLDDLKVDTAQGVTNQMFRTGDKISVYAPLSDVAPVVGASAEKIKKDEVICGVTGTYEGSGGGKYDPYYLTFANIRVANLDYETTNPNLDTSNVTSMLNMFSYCMNVTSLNVSSWNTSNVTTFHSFAENCSNLVSINFGNSFDTSNCSDFSNMFMSCSKLTSLDLTSFNTKKATNILQMFRGCSRLTHITFGSNFELPLLQTNHQNMFLNCTSLDNDTLNAILHVCTTMNVGTKTLAHIGLTSTQATTCTGLSNWAAAQSAGWTTGY